MKQHKLTLVAFLAATAAVGGILYLHRTEVGRFGALLSGIEERTERMRAAEALLPELDRYRLQSANFRRYNNVEIEAARKRMKSKLEEGIEALSATGSTEAELESFRQAKADLEILFTISRELEPRLYTRDAFNDPRVQGLHKGLLKTFQGVRDSANQGLEAARAKAGAAVARDPAQALLGMDRRILGLAGVVLLAFLVLIARGMLIHDLPLRNLRRRVRAAQEKEDLSQLKPLRGVWGEAVAVIAGLQKELAARRNDRMRFASVVAADLRPPLSALRTAAERLGNVAREPAESVQQALARLSAVLEGLTDLLDSESEQLKIEPSVMNVGECLERVARLLGGETSSHRMLVELPTQPVWASLDSDRLERVLIYLVSKLMLLQPQGGQIVLGLASGTRVAGDFEVVVYDGEPAGNEASRGPRAAAPEQELLKHWATQSGFVMKLVEKVVQAHGGAVTASGVAGTRLVFRLRFPKQRLAASRPTPGMPRMVPGTLVTAGPDLTQ